MSTLAVVNDDAPTAKTIRPKKSGTFLERATKTIEMEDQILAALVAKNKPNDERAFRLARRAQWRAAEWINNEYPFIISPTARWIEEMLDTAQMPGGDPDDAMMAEHFAMLAEDFAELMRKLTT
jgi:hypothetical protein